MARSRNIKPGFFVNSALVRLDALVRLLFIGLWTLADRAGRLEDDPLKIKMVLFPFEKIDDVDVDGMLTKLDAAGLICRYEVDGDRYIEVCNFLKHQNPHKKESSSVIPANPAKTCIPVPAPDLPEADPVPAVLIPDSGFLIPDSSPLIPDSAADAAGDGLGHVLADMVEAELGVTMPHAQHVKWRELGDWLDTTPFDRTQAFECFRLLRDQDWRTSPVQPKHVRESLPDLQKLRDKAGGRPARPPDVGKYDPAKHPEPVFACRRCFDEGEIEILKQESERQFSFDTTHFVPCPECNAGAIAA